MTRNTFVYNFNLKIICILSITVITLSCDVNKNKSSELLVAKVGNEKNSLDELETSLLLNSQYSVKTPIYVACRNQVDFLIEEKYYYLTSELVGLADVPIIKKRINYIKDHEILWAYINQEFLDKIILDKKGISTHAVSMPSLETFKSQSNEYKNEILSKKLKELS